MSCPLNFNIGVLGHVDSGKTSLCKALSTTASTAAFDKNPQSKERGITLDLGFSSFTVPISEEKKAVFEGFDTVQYTLVDCPGHASLIRTIIGGAQIIDLMFLVVDVIKGMQTQTAECLVIGQITCQAMMVVLNKTDLIPLEKRPAIIEKMKKRMWKTLENTRFHDCPIVSVAARPGGPEGGDLEAEGLNVLIQELLKSTYLPQRSPDGPFIFAVDHCFALRGQGTVMTGTVISGSVAINDPKLEVLDAAKATQANVEIPSMKVQKKVKSIQMFRKPVEHIMQGDRAGICVTQFDPKLLERGIISSPGALATVEAFIASVHKIDFFKGAITTKTKFHITVGHETVMGHVHFFAMVQSSGHPASFPASEPQDFDFSLEYVYQEELLSEDTVSKKAGHPDTQSSGSKVEEKCANAASRQFLLVELEKPVTCSVHALVIGSKLDTDIHANYCRLAFHGRICHAMTDPKYKETVLPRLKVYKVKNREGQVERVADAYSLIGKNLFKKETNIQTFTNLKVTLSTGQKGVIEGGFGQSGKVKIRIPEGLPSEIIQQYSGKKKNKKGGDVEEETPDPASQSIQDPVKIILSFKRYVYDPHKKMIQT